MNLLFRYKYRNQKSKLTESLFTCHFISSTTVFSKKTSKHLGNSPQIENRFFAQQKTIFLRQAIFPKTNFRCVYTSKVFWLNQNIHSTPLKVLLTNLFYLILCVCVWSCEKVTFSWYFKGKMCLYSVYFGMPVAFRAGYHTMRALKLTNCKEHQ